eukprot:TRINITY_DN1307_c0_g5_i2.p1 TRINITY_DN1307_c0_g5~~TRINITY_DN1307_c0_g5_i2.p1  ORF type:complete len:142 (-),score=16.21 TRINITY_DN1307_c0_g5_i2:316-741(-)
MNAAKYITKPKQHLNASLQESNKRGRKVTRLVLKKRAEFLPAIDRRTSSCQYGRSEDDNIEYVPDRWSPTGWKYRIKNPGVYYGKVESYDGGYKKPYPYESKNLVNLFREHRNKQTQAIRSSMILPSSGCLNCTNVQTSPT